MRVLLSGILLFALCSPAFAQDAGAVAQNFAWLGDNMRSLSHTLMTIGGVGLAIGLAAQAFGRRQVNVANVPTFPRYMTSPQQYRFGSIVFVIFASGFFLLLSGRGWPRTSSTPSRMTPHRICSSSPPCARSTSTA